MLDAIALGELLIDFATVDTDRDGYPTLAAHPGGAPGNFLAALHAYGCSGAMLGKVGADTFGNLLCATLAQAGIRTEGIVRDPSVFTTLAFVTFGPGGERAFSFARKPGADTQLRFDELDLSLLDEARLFHFGSLSLTQEPVRSATQQAVAYAAAHGKLLSFDPNLRLPLWPDADAAKTQILWGLRQADIVKISDDEVRFLWGCAFSLPFLQKYAAVKEIYLPIVQADHIILGRYLGENNLHAGAFGIMEPSALSHSPSQPWGNFLPPQFIIVPGMAFTPQGARLGRGKGFYDRFLALPGVMSAHKSGICFPFQIFSHIPTEPHDILMDSVVY